MSNVYIVKEEKIEELECNDGWETCSYYNRNIQSVFLTLEESLKFLSSFDKKLLKDLYLYIYKTGDLADGLSIEPSIINAFNIDFKKEYTDKTIKELESEYDPDSDSEVFFENCVRHKNIDGLADVIKNNTVDEIKQLFQNNNITLNVLLQWLTYTLNIKISHIETIKYLINNKIINFQESNNKFICDFAAKGRLEIIKYLMSNPLNDLTSNNNYAIRWAAHNGHTEVVKFLCSQESVNPTANNNQAIKWAVYFNHMKTVKILLKDKRVKETLSIEELIKYRGK